MQQEAQWTWIPLCSTLEYWLSPILSTSVEFIKPHVHFLTSYGNTVKQYQQKRFHVHLLPRNTWSVPTSSFYISKDMLPCFFFRVAARDAPKGTAERERGWPTKRQQSDHAQWKASELARGAESCVATFYSIDVRCFWLPSARTYNTFWPSPLLRWSSAKSGICLVVSNRSPRCRPAVFQEQEAEPYSVGQSRAFGSFCSAWTLPLI